MNLRVSAQKAAETLPHVLIAQRSEVRVRLYACITQAGNRVHKERKEALITVRGRACLHAPFMVHDLLAVVPKEAEFNTSVLHNVHSEGVEILSDKDEGDQTEIPEKISMLHDS